MKMLWLNESLVLRGETVNEKMALNVLYQSIGTEPDEVSGVLESGNTVHVLETVLSNNK